MTVSKRFSRGEKVTFIEAHEDHGMDCTVVRQEGKTVYLSLPGYGGYYPYPAHLLQPNTNHQ